MIISDKGNLFSDKKILKLQSEILTLFLANKDMDSLFESAISTIGRNLNFDKSYVHKYNHINKTYDLYHEWNKSKPPKDYYAERTLLFTDEFHDRFVDNKNLVITELKSNEINAYKSYISTRKIQSLICIPLFVGGSYFGIFGFESIGAIDNVSKRTLFITSLSRFLTNEVSKQFVKNKLQDSEINYKNLFNNMSSAFTNCEVIYDENNDPVDYVILEVNNRFEDITGIKAKDWIGRRASTILTNIEEGFMEKGAEVIKTGVPMEFESLSIPFQKYFHFSIFKSGENSFATISNDITEKKLTNDALVKNEKKYRNLFQSMQAGFANHEMIYDKDGNAIDFRFLEVNENFKNLARINGETFVGRTIMQISPDFRKKWIDMYAEVISTGKSVTYENRAAHLNKYHSITIFKTTENGFASLITDITYLKDVEHQLLEEKERLNITLESIGDGVIATDINGKVTMINHIAEDLTGWDKRHAIGKCINEVFKISNVLDDDEAKNPILKVIETGKKLTNSWYAKLKSKNRNKEYVISDTASPIKDKDGKILGAILVFRDVTEDKKRVDEIQYLSMHDPLTGLYNRSYLQKKLYELDENKAYPYSIIMGDANGLKITNDVFGHSEGDRLLKEIGQILLDSTGPNDIVSRWGGDEFVILMPDTHTKDAEHVCRKISKRCEIIAKNIDEYSACPSISLGYATRTKKDLDILKVIKSAEDWMYKRKLLESKSAHSSIIASMRKTLFEKSHETEEHAKRLNKYCKILGKELNLSTQDIYDLELFSLLHDIGKVAIDGRTLTKKGKLTDEEWEEIRRHPETGYRIANSAPELSQISEYILSHHERWDGKGYPQYLKGEDIPVQSRILSLIDSFDAMTHDRSYRKALSLDEAINEVKINAGKQFDPNVVEIFLEKIVPIYEF